LYDAESTSEDMQRGIKYDEIVVNGDLGGMWKEADI
jgi:hypothetical protein